MAVYQMRFRRNGKVASSAEHECADDLDALDKARTLSANADVEVWQGNTLIARVKKGDAPLNASDRTSG